MKGKDIPTIGAIKNVIKFHKEAVHKGEEHSKV